MVLKMTMAAAATITMLAACSKAPDPAPAPTADSAAQPATATPTALPRTAAPDGAQVYFISPQNGETVSSPVKIVFGLSGMGVAPAGTQFPNTGHHHLLIDTDLADPSMPIPTDDKHVHFGLGQTETTRELAPGTHTLQLVLGDHLHIPFDPVVASEKITITVK